MAVEKADPVKGRQRAQRWMSRIPFPLMILWNGLLLSLLFGGTVSRHILTIAFNSQCLLAIAGVFMLDKGHETGLFWLPFHADHNLLRSPMHIYIYIIHIYMMLSKNKKKHVYCAQTHGTRTNVCMYVCMYVM